MRRRVRCARGRADGQAVGKVRSEHAATAERTVLWYVLCGRTALIRSLATSREAVGKLLVPATQHGAGCGVQVCEGVGSRGSLEPGAMEQRALRTPSPLLLRRERAVVGRGHGQRTRERRWRRGCPGKLVY